MARTYICNMAAICGSVMCVKYVYIVLDHTIHCIEFICAYICVYMFNIYQICRIEAAYLVIDPVGNKL